jgi:hypothetical protein
MIPMKIFIDRADLGEIKKAAELGFPSRRKCSPRASAAPCTDAGRPHCATMRLKVLEELSHHPLTDVGLAKFLEDHATAGAKAR